MIKVFDFQNRFFVFKTPTYRQNQYNFFKHFHTIPNTHTHTKEKLWKIRRNVETFLFSELLMESAGVSQLFVVVVAKALKFFDVYVIKLHAQLNTSAIKNARNFPETWRWTKYCAVNNDDDDEWNQRKSVEKIHNHKCTRYEQWNMGETKTKQWLNKRREDREREANKFFWRK